MNDSQLFISLIKLGLWDCPFDEGSLHSLSDEDWLCLYKESQAQGLAAVFVDGVDKLKIQTHSCRSFIKKYGIKAVLNSEKRWQRQLQLVSKLAEFYQDHNIYLLLLKGLGISLCYSKPKHRESGDIDIYLFGLYEEGNNLAKQLPGAKVVKFSKKEDHILLGGFSIDNHIDFLWVDSYEKRQFDQFLKNLLLQRKLMKFPDTNILLPPNDFNFLFLLSHSYSHFMREGMPMRQMTDIACFLNMNQNDLDWDLLCRTLQEFHLKKFSDAIISFIQHYFELPVGYGTTIDTRLLELMYCDIIGKKHTVIYHRSWLVSKMFVARIAFQNRWRYNAFYEGGFVGYIIDCVKKIIKSKRIK